MLEILKKIPFFSDMPEDDLEKIKSIVIDKKYSKRAHVFSEGQEADGFYFVNSGKVKIFKLSPEGKEHVLHICGAGEMFAEAAMFSGKAYPAYAETIAESSLLFIQKKKFLELIKNDPEISIKMLGALSTKLRKFAATIEDLSLKEVSARLARYLIELADKNKSNKFKLDMKKTDLALKLGTVSETLSRTLKKLKDKGVIDSDKNQITALDMESLNEIANGMKI